MNSLFYLQLIEKYLLVFWKKVMLDFFKGKAKTSKTISTLKLLILIGLLSSSRSHLLAMEVQNLLNGDLDVASIMPPLYEASLKGDLNRVKELIASKADVNIANFGDMSALHIASMAGHTSIVRELLENGANREALTAIGASPLYYAAGNGYGDVVELLLLFGSKIDVADKSGWTPLHIAALQGHQNVVAVLVRKGAQVNVPDNIGGNPLHWAASNGHRAIVEMLIAQGANVNALTVGEFGQGTPLHGACMQGHAEVVEVLLRNQADLKALTGDGETPLHCALKSAPHFTVKLIEDDIKKVLIEKGLGAYVTDKPIINIGDRYAYKRVIELLLAYGAEVHIKDGDGKTPIDYAEQEEIKTLLQLNLCRVCLSTLIPEQGNVVPVGPACIHRVHSVCRQGLIDDQNFDGKCPACHALAKHKDEYERCFQCNSKFKVGADSGVLVGQNCTHRIHADCRKELVESKFFKGICPICSAAIDN